MQLSVAAIYGFPEAPLSSTSEVSRESRGGGSHLDSQALEVAGSPSVLFLPIASRGPNPSKLIQQFMTLRPDQQLHIFNTLKSHLTDKGMLTGAPED